MAHTPGHDTTGGPDTTPAGLFLVCGSGEAIAGNVDIPLRGKIGEVVRPHGGRVSIRFEGGRLLMADAQRHLSGCLTRGDNETAVAKNSNNKWTPVEDAKLREC